MIDLFNNEIRDQVPRWLWLLPKLVYVDISYNSFNSLVFPFQASSVNVVFASNNNLTGTIPKSICKGNSLVTLDLSDNHFHGSIPRCLGNSTGSLIILNLQRNNLSGSLPQFCNVGSNLTTIEVGHNRIEGKLPRSLMKCGNLKLLNVENNQINDTFPFWMTTLPSLEVLVLRSNLFHGSAWLPRAFSKLRIIDVSHNLLVGSLPSTYFCNWSTMSSAVLETDLDFPYMMSRIRFGIYENSVVLTSKGTERLYEKIRTDLIAIDYSNNRFEGPIPESIGMLKALKTLNLAGNVFTGQIPSSLINLISLESLDLSRNQLSGVIPPDLVKSSSYLSTINLSHNKLAGHIPQSPQFQTQTIWSFVGNKGLCGLPLPTKCGDVNPTVQATEPANDPDHISKEEMFCWIAAAVAFVPAFVVAATVTHWKK